MYPEVFFWHMAFNSTNNELDVGTLAADRHSGVSSASSFPTDWFSVAGETEIGSVYPKWHRSLEHTKVDRTFPWAECCSHLTAQGSSTSVGGYEDPVFRTRKLFPSQLSPGPQPPYPLGTAEVLFAQTSIFFTPQEGDSSPKTDPLVSKVFAQQISVLVKSSLALPQSSSVHEAE
ncbi:hypothetical protein UY3_13568 [Chelonia mydas]|uniref:Uncharacterized protein n=1 Tax=Chelonia mydas TaxID=8469 RepID=M7AX54_CHEMY|nr:hypothetical protein UY3_13568 [Chelonia mydas]